MKKRTSDFFKNRKARQWNKLLLILSLFLLGQVSFSQSYCVPVYINNDCTDSFKIEDFVIQDTDINHIDSGCSANSYGNFTNEVFLKGSLNQGKTYEFTLLHGSSYMSTKIYLDFNANGSFEDTDELLFSSAANSTNTTTGTFTISSAAPLTANTRLRIITSYQGLPSDSCTPYTFYSPFVGMYFAHGETHDYAVEILPPPLPPSYCNPMYINDDCSETNLKIEDFIIQNAGINHIGSGCSANSFGNFTNDISLKGSLKQGETYEFNIVQTGIFFKIYLDFNGNGSYEDEGELLFSSSTSSITSGQFTIPLTAPLTSSTRLRIIGSSDSVPVDSCTPYTFYSPFVGMYFAHGETHDYSVEILPPPDYCLSPSSLDVDNMTPTSANLTWLGTGNTFQIEYGENGFLQGNENGTIIDVNANFHALSGLYSDTNYEFYVRQYCTEIEEYSLWSGPFSFYTGYCSVSTATSSARISSFSTSDGYTNIINTNNGISGAYSNFTNLNVVQSAGGSFKYSVSPQASYTYVDIWIDYNNNLSFEENELVASHQYSAGLTSFNGTITIPQNLSEGDYRIRIRSRQYQNFVITQPVANPCGEMQAGETEDYTLTIVPIPDCIPPTALTVISLTDTSAELSWNSNGNLFDIEYGALGFVPGNGIIVNNISNSYTLTGLDSETNYWYYVRKYCVEEDVYSFWTGPFEFYTGYCTVSTTTSLYRISDFSTSDGYMNIINLNNGTSHPYSDFSDYAIVQSAGGSFNYVIDVPSNGAISIEIWIDYNNNMLFEANEMVAQNTYGTSPFTGTITIPGNLQGGDYRIRVRTRPTNTSVVAPCSISTGGETEDYTLSIIPLPECFLPINVAVNGWTPNSVDLSWTSIGTSFEIEYGESNFVQGNGIIIPVDTNSYTIEGLESETNYVFYVRQYCEVLEEYSFWAGPFTFYTGYCSASVTYNYSIFNISGFSTLDGYTNVQNMNNGTEIGYNDFTNHTVSISSGGSFDYNIGIPNNSNNTNVKIWIDYNNNLLFEEEELVADHNGIYTTSFTGTITIPESILQGNYRIRVRSSSVSSTNPCGVLTYGETEDYTLSVISEPACIPPTNLKAIPTYTSAQLFWISNGNSFDIEWGGIDFIQGEGNIVNNVSNFYNLTELQSETFYQYYVRQNCEEEDQNSTWQGPYAFYTGYCLVTSGTGYRITDFSTSNGYNNITNLDNGISNSYSDFADHIVTHSSGGSIKYNLKTDGYSKVKIWIDYNNNMSFEDNELVAEHTSSPTSQSFSGIIIIPADLQQNNYRIRVRSSNNSSFNSCGGWDNGETEDYTLTIVPTPTCIPPMDLSAELTFTSALLSWSSDGSLFDIEWGENGFNLGDGNILNNVSNPYNLTDLDSETSYQYYVRQDCVDNGFSTWQGPYSFYTAYCESFTTSQNSSYYISSFTATGSTPNVISNSVTNFSSNGYGDFTNMSVEQFETGTIDFTVVTSGFYMETYIWVDWNQDMVFQESEKVASFTELTNGVQNFSGSFFVPLGVPAGDYRMRIRTRYNDLNNLPCGDITNGETEDYTITVITPPSCLIPYLPTSTNISATSTELAWQSNGNLFDVEYGLAGFVQGSTNGTIISEVGNPYLLSNFIQGQIYEYYVRQNCGEEEYGDWNGPVTFIPGINYNGNIPTMLNNNPQVEDDACGILFNVEVPEGYFLSTLNLKYRMISVSPALMSQQRSVLYSPTLGFGEIQVVEGETNFPGYIDYNRNVTFVNGATGVLEFELKAWRIEGGIGCNTTRVYIMDGTWILTPEFVPIPTCPNPPSELSYTNITEDSVNLIWTADEGTFQVIWGNIDFDIESESEGTMISDITTNSHNLSGLDSSILYEFYVRRNCSTEDTENYGEWVGPFKFNTGYCIPTSGLAYYFSQFNTIDAIENITFTYPNTALGTGYKDETDMFVSQEAGTSFSFSVNYSGGASGLRIWVDWNNNFIFEDTEQVFYLGNDSGSKSGTITIPEGTLPGNYRMRIRAQQLATSVPPACENINTGEAIDFTLNIPCGEIVIPIGNTTQNFEEGATLTDLDVTGTNLVWYSDADLTDVLEETTLLTDNTTYYVINIAGDCQSDVLTVTVNEVLSTSDFTKFRFGYYPNPVNEVLYLRSNTEISEVIVFNILGQQLNLSIQANNNQIDMTGLPSGNYVMSVTIEGIRKTFKIVKQ